MIPYRFGHNPVAVAFIAGEPVYVRDDAAAARLQLVMRTARASRRWPTPTATRSSSTCAASASASRSPKTTSGAGGRRCTGWRRCHDPDSMREVGAACLRADGGRRVRRGRRVSLRPSPAGRHAVPGAERDGDRAGRGGGRRAAWRSRCCRPPTTAAARGGRRIPARSASATRRWRRSWSGSTRCATGRPAAPGVEVGVAAHSVRAVPASGCRRSPAMPTSTASSVTSTPPSSGASWPSAGTSTAARRSSCSTAPASSDRAPASSTPSMSPSAMSSCWRAPGRSSSRCPTTEGNLGDGFLPGLRYRDAGVRLAIGTDEQIRIDPFEELREMETLARREGQTRFALLAAAGGDLWGQMVANGRASLGLRGGAARSRDRPRPSGPGGRGRGRPGAGAGHLRIRGRGPRRRAAVTLTLERRVQCRRLGRHHPGGLARTTSAIAAPSAPGPRTGGWRSSPRRHRRRRRGPGDESAPPALTARPERRHREPGRRRGRGPW